MFDPQLAEIRFGYGISPLFPAPESASDMVHSLRSKDEMAHWFLISSTDEFLDRAVSYRVIQKKYLAARGTDEAEGLKKEQQASLRKSRTKFIIEFRNTILRRLHTRTAFRERLAAFWGDHFTAMGKAVILRWGTSPYIETAIRPNLVGKFEDMLVAVVTQPLMLHYLDQNASIGPNSEPGKKSEGKRGLNENLAREVLELHTLGVNGPYTQHDVTELAELFTGMSLDKNLRFRFKMRNAEPGAETVLGKTYAGRDHELTPIKDALRDLARHPATAKHLATKLAQHFVSDTPNPDLVAVLEKAYLDSDGDLGEVYSAMLAHPASWSKDLMNIKPAADFMSSALRSLGARRPEFDALNNNQLRDMFYSPLEVMGQPWQQPSGPDGWPEENDHWVTPQFLAARLNWSLAIPQLLMKQLPDPRELAKTALGPYLTRETAFAAGAAENKWEAIALVLTSPAFQKR